MAEVIRMPRMSDTMEEGVIVGWLKEEGEEIESGETLAEVETDKATMELDSYSDGVLLHIAVKEGPVPINGVIAVIGEAGEDWKAAIAAASDGDSETTAAPTEAATAPVAEPVSEPIVATSGERIKASPLAKSMAKEAGINLAEVSGSGDHGRIVKRDIEMILGGKQTTAAPKSAPALQAPAKAAPKMPAPSYSTGNNGANYEDVAISQMRKAIAKNVVANKFTVPHFYLTTEIDMEQAIAARIRMNEIAPTKISFNDLAVKAAAVALRQHPVINAAWLEDNKIRYNGDVNIGVAVDTGDGLLIPVVRHADMKSLSQINTEVRAYAGQAKEKKLQPKDQQGSTFTISNLGMFGIEEFTAIINRPNACILAVSAIVEKPVVKNGELAVGKRMRVTLSCDHRVVDGVAGAKFLKTYKEILEDPIRMLV
ncbi:MAG: dihydrolipoamide acetyltransferase family protein [Saprospiraceae bacterium]